MEFYINGRRQAVQPVDPQETLIKYLRRVGYTGTKLGCSEGGCGSCTVMVSKSPTEHIAVNACLMPLCAVSGQHVITVEGIGTPQRPHAVQQRIAEYFGSQCGFCTPGFVMSLYAFLRTTPHPTREQLEQVFDGNLCRCTGYRPLLDASKSFACKMGDDCCKVGGKGNGLAEENVVSRNDGSELIFPPGLVGREVVEERYEMNGYVWYKPVTLDQLLKVKQSACKIVCGNTEIGIETKFKGFDYMTLVYPMAIKELQQVIVHEGQVEFGSCLNLTALEHELRRLVEQYGQQKGQAFQALLDNIKWFAGRQVRNVATLAGNIVTASPISDINPVLMAVDAQLKVQSYGKDIRYIQMKEFFVGYRKTLLQQDEVLLSVIIPFAGETEYVQAYKQSKRREDDIAIVTSGMKVKFDDGGLVESLCLAFGGMAAYTTYTRMLPQQVVGISWDKNLLDKVTDYLMETQDLALKFDAPGGMVEYRRSLTCSLFYKFFSHVQGKNDLFLERSRPVSVGQQSYQQSHHAHSVGKNKVHLAALKQVTGQAQYIDDMPKLQNELYAAPILSTKARARIVRLDFTESLGMPGVKGIVTHKDVPGTNRVGPVFKDEELFASDQVYFAGQLIAMVVAQTQQQAWKAARKAMIEYEILPHILKIEEAVEQQSFFEPVRRLSRGTVDFSKSDHVIEGSVRCGGQNHFYLETQASIVVPKGEDQEFDVYASTQHPTETQFLVAHVLHIPANRVVCKCKRMGGGFGGKESRSCILSCAVAVAANKHQVPVRCMLDRDEDMQMCGTRHPFLGNYKVGFDSNGKIDVLDLQLFSNGGFSADLSVAVMERAVSHADNCYWIPNVSVVGRICKTNIHSNTAFRGFGGPQGMLVAETWICHIAQVLGKTPEEVRFINFYNKGQLTLFQQPLDDWKVPQLWQQATEISEFTKRKQEVQLFNEHHQFKKRGLSLIPTKFGIAFGIRFLNQAGALVHIYIDGSVLLSHGGTEMGQGLHTKMVQVCADALGIQCDRIHIQETATDKVANTSATAASASSDLNGMAVLDACHQLNERLSPYKFAHPTKPFVQIVQMAYFDRINLSANGFYKTPDLNFSWKTGKGKLFNYFTFGVAATEVEVDCLTGDHQILRSDIVMDLGQSLNPQIDIGQIEGAFTQGIGWCTIEEQHHLRNGQLLTRGPGNYKIPGASDIPIDMRVTLLKDSHNARAVHSSKAVGEPPLFLGSSVFFAIREAIESYRVQNDHVGYFRLDSPATSERIRMACEDQYTKKAQAIPKASDVNDWIVRT